MTRELLKGATVPAVFLAAIAFGAMTAPASAAEFCRTDVTGHMTSCGFDSMAQCQAAASGIGGDCFRDPYLKDAKNGNKTDNENAYAYRPKASRSKNGTPAARKAAPTYQ